MTGHTDRERQLDAILQAVADAILIADSDGIVRYANAASEEIFGRPLSRIVDRPFGFPIVVGNSSEVDIVHPDGRPVVAELRTVPITWEDEPACLISLRDITMRKRAAQDAQRLLREQMARAQAEESEVRARFLLEVANALAASLNYSVTLNNVARVCSEYYADWCVVDIVEMDGELKRVAVAQRDPMQAELARQLAELSPEKHPLPSEPEVLRKAEPALLESVAIDAADDGYREILQRIAPRAAMVVPLVSRKNALGVITFISSSVRDYTRADLNIVTELAQHAATAIDNSRLFQEAQRGNEAKANFLAVISHELRTPLNAVIGYTDLLRLGLPVQLPPEALVHVERIRQSSRHLLHLIDEILSFSRLEAGRAAVDNEWISVADVGRTVSAMISPLAQQKGLEFKVELPERDYRICTDQRKLERILLNLLSNAVKFTPGGKVELDIVSVDNWTHFHVKDSGLGIAPEQ